MYRKKHNKCIVLRNVSIALLIFVGWGASSLELILPWHIETAMSMLVWYELGIAIHEESNIIRELCAKIGLKSVTALTAFFIIGVAATFFNFRIAVTSVQVRKDLYGNQVLYYIAAVSGITLFCGISQLIKCNKFFKYIGRNSMTILVMHKFPILIFREIIPVTKDLLNGNVSNSLPFMICAVIVSITSISLCLIAGAILVRVAPWTIGRKRFKESGKIRK